MELGERVRRYYDEVLNTGDLDRMAEFVAEDWVDLSPFPGQPQGLEGSRARLAGVRNAFPDFHLTIVDQITNGDRVAQRVTGTGTHLGEFMGIPPTGRSFEVTAVELLRFRGGKEVEHFVLIDMLSMLGQLGVIPQGAMR